MNKKNPKVLKTMIRKQMEQNGFTKNLLIHLQLGPYFGSLCHRC